MRNLNNAEIQNVNGGILPLLAAAAVLLLSGCSGGEKTEGAPAEDTGASAAHTRAIEEAGG